MSIPSDRSFTKEHEWARVEGERVRVGITDYAQGQLGAVVYLDFTSIGTAVKAGDVLAEIESTKAVSEVYAPVAGTVVEVNASLVDHPEYVNDEPYDKGWIALLEAPGASLDRLLEPAAYQERLDEEESKS
jgi:glycine cleavage system H protein